MKVALKKTASNALWEFELCESSITIGCNADADLELQDNSVAAAHCELAEYRGRLGVRDLGSNAGTFVNGQRIQMAAVLPGDTLSIGATQLLVYYHPAESAFAPRTCPKSGNMGSSETKSHVGKGGEVLSFFQLLDLLDSQRRRYQEMYRRDFQEAMFPDPPHPEHLEHLVVLELRSAGVAPEYIYAFEQTGVLVTDQNQSHLDEATLEAWQRALQDYENREFDGKDTALPADEIGSYPLGLLTKYGPDRVTTTMLVATIIRDEMDAPMCRRWLGSGVQEDEQVKQEILDFFEKYRVRRVYVASENVACVHQEGMDYPRGQACPFCPDWSRKG